jgi:hypothetical protein
MGRALLIRGYQEDSQETFAPRTIFDTTLPTWRMGECLLHAQRLAAHIAIDPSKTKVRFRALYTGLSGRVLRAWANPLSDLMFEGGGARSDEAMFEAVIPVDECRLDLQAITRRRASAPARPSYAGAFGPASTQSDRPERCRSRSPR